MTSMTSLKTPLFEWTWAYMPKGIYKILSSEPITPAIAAEAKELAAKNPDFIRSEQGQIVGIFPEMNSRQIFSPMGFSISFHLFNNIKRCTEIYF
ncbi:hypothetical protein ACFLRM_03445 [Acidobacteriota bacterium]